MQAFCGLRILWDLQV